MPTLWGLCLGGWSWKLPLVSAGQWPEAIGEEARPLWVGGQAGGSEVLSLLRSSLVTGSSFLCKATCSRTPLSPDFPSAGPGSVPCSLL